MGLQSVIIIMGKTSIWAILCFHSFLPLNNVEKQRGKVVPSYGMGSQHCRGRRGAEAGRGQKEKHHF